MAALSGNAESVSRSQSSMPTTSSARITGPSMDPDARSCWATMRPESASAAMNLVWVLPTSKMPISVLLTSLGRSRSHVNRLPLNGILTDCKKVMRAGRARLTLRHSALRRRVRFRRRRYLDDAYVGSAERLELLLGCALVRDQRRYAFNASDDH